MTGHQKPTSAEPLIDARAFIPALIAFLAESKRMPNPTRENRIRERRSFLAEQAAQLGVGIGGIGPSKGNGDA